MLLAQLAPQPAAQATHIPDGNTVFQGLNLGHVSLANFAIVVRSLDAYLPVTQGNTIHRIPCRNPDLEDKKMAIFSTVRELAEGLKLGARFAFTEKHSMIEKGVQPRVTKINGEGFGR